MVAIAYLLYLYKKEKNKEKEEEPKCISKITINIKEDNT